MVGMNVAVWLKKDSKTEERPRFNTGHPLPLPGGDLGLVASLKQQKKAIRFPHQVAYRGSGPWGQMH